MNSIAISFLISLKNDIELTEDIIETLSSFEKYHEPKFLEIIDGEIVVS